MTAAAPTQTAGGASEMSPAMTMLADGGPVVWMIAALSVIALALVIWKLFHFVAIGAFRRGAADRAIALWRSGQREPALAEAARGGGVVDRVVAAALAQRASGASEAAVREEAARVAKGALAEMRVGLRGLEVIATIAPLLGLLGTVLGMIAAFQALQTAGAQADPATLAGGIWEALLTTAAGMSVAIPSSIALSWGESVVEKTRLRIEDAAARLMLPEAGERSVAPQADAA